MTSVSSVSPLPMAFEPADDATMISVAERAGYSSGKIDLIEEAWKDAFRDMMVQPFVELMFYGEEEETGNVTLSTAL